MIKILRNASVCILAVSLLLSVNESNIIVSRAEFLPYDSEITQSSVWINGYGWSSTGEVRLSWFLEPGDSGCSGVEVAGVDRNGEITVLAELPVTNTEYLIKGAAAFGYATFIVRPYIQEGEQRIYGQQDEKNNDLYIDGYFISDGVTGVKYPSRAQIRKMYKKLSPKNKKNKYEKAPKNKKPYRKGAVAKSTLKNGLNTLNFIRYVAGISSDVKVKQSYQTKAQAAAVVNYNDKTSWISHYPAKPAGMNNSLYKQGASGSASSNLAAGQSTLYNAIVNGWMSDSDSYNITRVGHRRWCLNPSMKYTGFGIDGNVYAMYSFDKSGGESGVHGVHWPAHNTPLSLFDKADAWSISMGTVIEKPKKIKVTLTRKRDQKRWVFTLKNKKKTGNYMNVNNDSYGQKGCIIFRPKSIKYKKGDSFTVKISGTDFSFSYDVNFFSL